MPDAGAGDPVAALRWRHPKVLIDRERIEVGYDRFLPIYCANALPVRPQRTRTVRFYGCAAAAPKRSLVG
jgi:hypothetical protein